MIMSKFDSKCLQAHKAGRQAFLDGKKQTECPIGHAGTYDYTDDGILRKIGLMVGI